MKSTITKRWVRGSLFFTLAVLLVAEAIFLWYTITGYYNGARNAMQSEFASLRAQLSSASSGDRGVAMRRAVEQFESKNRFELMLISRSGKIEVTSSGMMPSQEFKENDVWEALQTGEQSEFIGELPTGERVLAMTQKTPYSTDGIVAMRLVTSLTRLEKSMQSSILYSAVFLMIVLLASIISGVYFIRSIVMPLRTVEATAARIAQGDFETRINIKNNDEIGNLCKTINHMAEELSRTEQMKNDFISSVSHELRTPLTSIKGWTETIGQISNPEDPNFRRGVAVIAGETDRLYDMVEELLDFSRMQNGLKIDPKLLDLAAEVEEAVLVAQSRAEGLGLCIEFDAPELPVAIMGDGNRIRQVFLNVLDNAIKYSFPGGCIKIEILQDTANAYVLVNDHGQGIDGDELENVKMRFYKGKGAVRGSGIGLAVVDELMCAHDGSFEIGSEVGKGTTVTLRFPLYHKKGAKAGALNNS